MCNNRADVFGEVTRTRECAPNGRKPNLGNHNMRISNRFEKHIAAAAAVAMGATAAANAAVVYSGVINFVCAPTSAGVYINFQTPRVTNEYFDDYQLNAYSNDGFRFGLSTTEGGLMRREGVTTGTGGNLALGTSIGSLGSYDVNSPGDVYGTTSETGLLGGWTYSSENIIGFQFVAADTLIHYGWMRFAMGAAGSASANTMTRTLVDYGYESTAGASILAGAVPAPGALALLGVAGLAGARRRRA